ncbi:hypothetical protein FACS189454_05790 [Planctomycetales bacterium]|nr:hypothetical protein FACS189454_05790 [Planctomycetales bacterium]
MMKRIISFPANKSKFVLELLQQISYVKVEADEKPSKAKTAAKRVRQPALTAAQKKKNTEQLLEDLRDSFEQVRKHEAGYNTCRPAREVLAEM